MKSEFKADSTVDLETVLAGASNPEGFLPRFRSRKFSSQEVLQEVLQAPTPGPPGVGYWSGLLGEFLDSL